MKLRFMNGRLSGHMVDVLPTGMVIGRGESSDLAIEEEGVSRRHARIFLEDGTWFVEDLGSTNGIRVNGTRVAGRFCVKPGDRIGIFNQTLLFTDDADVVDVDTLTMQKPPQESDVKTLVQKPPAVPGGAEKLSQSSSGTTVAPQTETNLNWLKAIVLLILVAGLAWFARETLIQKNTGDGTPPVDETAGETPLADPGVVVEEDEPPSVVVEIPGMEPEPPDEDPVQIIQVNPIEVPDAPDPVAPPPQDDRAGGVAMFVQSLPSGAELYLGGLLQGKTPMLLRNLGDGEHEIRLAVPGYEPLVRTVRIPGPVPVTPLILRLKAGAVKITSTPANAAVFHGSQYLGTTPLVTDRLPAGKQELRLMKVGYEGARGTVTVSGTAGVEKTFTLASMLGGIEFITVPAGCNIYIDNVLKGRTEAVDAQTNKSKPFRVNGLKEGEHQARVEHPNGAGKSDIVTIRRGTVATAVVELWVVDTKLTLKDGTDRFGMLFSVNGAGDVLISEKVPGEKMPRPKQYFKEQILAMTEVGPEEGREQMEAVTGQQVKINGPDNGLEPPEFQLLPAGDDPEGGTGEVTLTFTADALSKLVAEKSATALAKMIGGREVILTGVPTDIDTDLVRAHIHFGKVIVCEIPRKDFDDYGHELVHAEENRLPVTIRGKTVAGVKMVTLRGCTYTPHAK